MGPLAVPSSRVVNLGVIEAEENASALQPSSRQSSKGHHIYTPISSEFDCPSGTPNDIAGDEDAESTTTSDEYYDARSSVSPWSTIRSSLSRIGSASRESLASVQSLLLAHSFGAHHMNIRELVQYLRSKHRLSEATISAMTTYYSQSVVKHMFVVLRLNQGNTESWLRLDRRVEDPLNASFISSGMQGPAKDVVKAASKLENLIEASDIKHSQILFEKPPPLKVLESLLVAIYEESKDYRIWPENCWFFCSLIQEHLYHRHGGRFEFGELYRPTLGLEARARISGRLDGMSISRSRSLLSRVVRRPSMPSAVIAEANASAGCRYIIFTPDGAKILHGSYEGVIRVWDLSLRKPIKIRTKDPSQVGDWASLLDDRIIVSGSSNGSFNFWDATSRTPVRFCAASRGSETFDFTYLASAPDDLTGQRWERVIRDADRWQGDSRVPNKMHDRVAYTSKGSVLVDEKSSNTPIANLHVGPRLQDDLKLSPSGKSISFRLGGSDDSYLWNIDTQTVYRLEKSLYLLGFWGRYWTPDGHYIVIERRSDFVVWDTRTGALVSILNFHSVFQGRLRFSPNGRYLGAADDWGEVKLWDMEIAQLCGPYHSNHPLPIHDGMVDFSQ